MAQYTEYHPLKFWLDPASIAEIVAHIQTYLVNNPINSTTEIETIIHDYLIAHPELIGGVESVNGETGEVILTADNISAGETVTIKDVLDSLQDQINDIVISIPSDYQQLINDVSDLKSALEDLITETISSDDIIQGSYDVNGNPTSNSTRIRTRGFTLVKKGSQVKFKAGNVCTGLFYGAFSTSYGYLRDYGWYNGDYSFDVTEDTNYIFTFRKTDNSAITPAEYDATLEIVKPLSLEIDSLIDSVNGIRVEKDGSGDFTTLKEALEYAIKGESVKVYVGAGTYDLIEEFGADYFAGISESGRWGLKLGGRMHIIFASGSKVTCNYTGSNTFVKQYFSPFNCSNNTDGFTIENLTLECSNVRYCIHDEVNSQTKPYKNVYKNCSLSIDNTSNTVWPIRTCIGGGLGTSGEVIIENCYFESVGADSSSKDIVSYHNNGVSTGRNNVVITGCYFANADSCRCSYYGTSTEKSKMIVSNCSLGRAPQKTAEASATVDNFDLITWNNEIRT